MPGDKPIIVFINHWAAHPGGAEYSLLDILEYIAPRCLAHLITSETGIVTERAASFGVACHVIPCALRPEGKQREHFLLFLARSWRECISFLGFVRGVFSVIKSVRPDCVHANVPKSHVTLFLASLFGYQGKCCFHLRELFSAGSVLYLFYRCMFPYKQGSIIAISEAVKSNLPAALRKKAVVIYNGVAIPGNVERAARKAEIRFLYLGRIVPWKGCHHLVELFAMLKKRCPDAPCSLTLIGDTLYWSQEYRHEVLDGIQRHGLSSCCFLKPHCPSPYDAYAAHDVFCNASRNEPFGRSMAEAQAAGLPVIAYDGGGVKEIVETEKTGIVLPYGDKHAFVNAMERLLKDPVAVCRMGKSGRQRAGRLFNREMQVPRIAEEIMKPYVQ